MSDVITPRRGLARGALAAVVSAALVAVPVGAQAAGEDESTWSASWESYQTGVQSGYQLAYDSVNDEVYVADAQWRVEAKGAIGTVESTPGANSMRTTFSPYGVAVDPTLGEEGVIVTTTARQNDPVAKYGGGVVIYDAAQGGPTDADRVYDFADGSPILAGPRRVAVNTQTHLAFVTNLGAARSSKGPGFILVLDLTKRGAEAVVARVGLPGDADETAEGWWSNPVTESTEGVVGVAVDEENNLVYVGTMNGEKLFVIDGDQLDGSKDARNTQAYASAITELDAVVGPNARPTYNAETKKVYVSAYDDSTITVVNADPADTAAYGTVEHVIDVTTGGASGNKGTNAVEVDAERGLLYSANLDAGVTVYDIENGYAPIVFSDGEGGSYTDIPLPGRSVNFGLNQDTGEIWVSTWSNAGQVHVLTVSEQETPALSATERFVTQAYRDFIGVDPTPAQLAAGVAASGSGQPGRSAFLDALSKSDQWISALITGYYQDTLGRTPSASEIEYYAAQLRGGEAVATVASRFYASPEYRAGFASDVAWVTDLYQTLMDRSPEAGGAEYYAARLASGEFDPTRVVLNFYASPEKLGKRVNALYEQLLLRPAEPAGIAWWSPLVLEHGDLILARELAASQEYYDGAQSLH